MKKIKKIFLTIAFISLNYALTNLFRYEKDPALLWKLHPLSHLKTTSYTKDPTNEPQYHNQHHLKHINIGDTWQYWRGKNVTVAVIDSGININHVDFWDDEYTNITSTSAYVEERGVYTSNIVIQPVSTYGLTIVNDPISEGHGTNVSGTIGALVNSVGTTGVSPSVQIMALKTNLLFTEIEAAIRYAADNGADIINMSLGVYKTTFTDKWGERHEGVASADTYFQSAINYAYNKGVTIIAAAGNEATSNPSYPASYDQVIGVGALANDSSTNISYYSNSGFSNVTLVAPGTVYVTDVGGSNLYAEVSGTSFSAPIVAAAAALYKEQVPHATPEQIKNRLIESSFDLGAAGLDSIFGYGRLDIKELLNNIIIDSMELTPANSRIRVGETVQLDATFTPDNIPYPQLEYVSSNDLIASVDEYGLVTGIEPGETTITASANNANILATAHIEVHNDPIALEEIGFDNSEINLKLGTSKQLEPIFFPENATNKHVTYVSSDTSIVSVNNDGYVSSLKTGSATVKVISDDGQKEASIIVNVIYTTVVERQTVFTSQLWDSNDGAWINLRPGSSFANGVKVTKQTTGASFRSLLSYSFIRSVSIGYFTDTNSGSGNIKVELINNFDDESVEFVSSYNTTVAGGTNKRYLNFSFNDFPSGFLRITTNVTTDSVYISDIVITNDELSEEPTKVTGVNFSQQSITLTSGDNTALQYEVLPVNATNKNVSFYSHNSTIAHVNNTGIVTALLEGTTQITITTIDGEFTDTITINVLALPQEEITPQLILNTKNFRINYNFGDPIDIFNLEATYFDKYGTEHLIYGHELNYNAAITKSLGAQTLLFSYRDAFAQIDIHISNVGIQEKNGETIDKEVHISMSKSGLTIGTASNEHLSRTKFTSDGMHFFGAGLQNHNDVFVIYEGGYLYNTIAIGNIKNITISYNNKPYNAGVSHHLNFSQQILKSKPVNDDYYFTTSPSNSTRELNAPANDLDFFRLDIDSGNLEISEIIITYIEKNEQIFTHFEQAEAFNMYFNKIIGNIEQIEHSLNESKWLMLSNEYSGLINDAVLLIKTHQEYSELRSNYEFIVATLGYNDFMGLKNDATDPPPIPPTSDDETSPNTDKQKVFVIVMSGGGFIFLTLLTVFIVSLYRKKPYLKSS